MPAGMDDVSLYTELGRYMLGPYGCLLTRAIHEKNTYKHYIGVDACAANLMRPAIYGAYHHITVLGKEHAPCDHTYDVTGSLCENCDKFAVDRELPKIDIGDLQNLQPGATVPVTLTRADGSQEVVPCRCRIDTATELTYYQNDGILHYVIRNMLK